MEHSSFWRMDLMMYVDFLVANRDTKKTLIYRQSRGKSLKLYFHPLVLVRFSFDL